MIALKGISRTESKLEKFKNRVRADGGSLLNYDTIQSLYSGLPALVRSDASMVMLPCGYRSGKVYGLNGNDFTFSRASNATRVNENGLIELVSSNIPRFQFDPVTKQYQGLLMEKASTNLLTWSEDFSNAVWNKTGVTIGVNSISSPNGTLTADALIEDNTTGNHWIFQAGGTAADHTASVYLKAGNRTWAALRVTTTGSIVGYAYFNLSNGTIGNVDANLTASIVDVGNGWYRCSIKGTTTLSTPIVISASSGNGIISYTGINGSSAIYVWGAQLEQSAVPTSYIPTLGASATRAADSLSLALSGVEGTLYADFNSFGSITTNRIFSLNDGTANNSIHADLSSFAVINGGVSQAAIGSTGASGKIAGAYKVNDFAFSKNGGAVATDTSGTIPTVNTLKVGAASSAGSELNGTIKALAYFPARRTNSELQTITT